MGAMSDPPVRHPDEAQEQPRRDLVPTGRIPRLPTFPARWVLEDPRRRPYLVFWVSDSGHLRYPLHMEQIGRAAAVRVTNRPDAPPTALPPAPPSDAAVIDKDGTEYVEAE